MTAATTAEPPKSVTDAARSARLAVVLLLGLACIPPQAPAEDIYKIVDDEGNITYSSEPPERGDPAEVLRAPPEPAEEDVEAAVERQQKIEERFDKLDRARAEQAQSEARQRDGATTTVIQSNTVLGGPRRWLYGPYWGGAPVAPGAPTAPGYRPPRHRPPGHRPPDRRPSRPIAVPHSAPGP